MIENQRISPSLRENIALQQAPMCAQRGFTLIELMIVLAIFGVLMAIGGTSWSSYREATRIDSAKEKVVSILQQARLKALTSGFIERVRFDWANDTITVGSRVVNMEPGIDLKGYTCGTPPVAYPTGVSIFKFKSKGSFSTSYPPAGNPRAVQVSSPTSSKVFYIKVNNTTGRVTSVETCP